MEALIAFRRTLRYTIAMIEKIMGPLWRVKVIFNISPAMIGVIIELLKIVWVTWIRFHNIMIYNRSVSNHIFSWVNSEKKVLERIEKKSSNKFDAGCTWFIMTSASRGTQTDVSAVAKFGLLIEIIWEQMELPKRESAKLKSCIQFVPERYVITMATFPSMYSWLSTVSDVILDLFWDSLIICAIRAESITVCSDTREKRNLYMVIFHVLNFHKNIRIFFCDSFH